MEGPPRKGRVAREAERMGKMRDSERVERGEVKKP